MRDRTARHSDHTEVPLKETTDSCVIHTCIQGTIMQYAPVGLMVTVLVPVGEHVDVADFIGVSVVVGEAA